MFVVILAGGRGLRIQEETSVIPKALIKINGISLIDRIMTHYSAYGFYNFLILTGYKHELISEHFKALGNWNFNTTCVYTGLETSTAGRLQYIKARLDEKFMLTYCDGVSDIDIEELLNFHNSHGRIGTVSAINPKERFGVLDINNEDEVLSFQEKKDVSDRWINGGFFVFEPSIFDYIDGDVMLENEPLQKLSKDKNLMSYKHNGFWKCVDNYKDKLELEEYYKKRGGC